MSIDKNLLAYNLKFKNYDQCISILRKEIIDILTKKIQEKKSDFKYINIASLKDACFKYLSEIEQDASIELYNFSFSEETPEFELSCMMELYKTLTT